MNNQNERITVESKEITTEGDQNKSAQEKAAEPDLATRLAIAEKEVAELRITIATLLNPRGPTPYQTNSDRGPHNHGGHYREATVRCAACSTCDYFSSRDGH